MCLAAFCGWVTNSTDVDGSLRWAMSAIWGLQAGVCAAGSPRHGAGWASGLSSPRARLLPSSRFGGNSVLSRAFQAASSAQKATHEMRQGRGCPRPWEAVERGLQWRGSPEGAGSEGKGRRQGFGVPELTVGAEWVSGGGGAAAASLQGSWRAPGWGDVGQVGPP